MIRAHGPENILCTSDFLWQSQCESLQGLYRFPLDGKDKKAILPWSVLRAVDE